MRRNNTTLARRDETKKQYQKGRKMKTLIIYDSQYGNTEKIAQILGKTLKAVVLHVSKVEKSHLKGVGLLIVGSPVHGGRATPLIDEFLSSLPRQSLTGVKVAAFDTRFASEDHGIGLRILLSVIRYAAERIGKELAKKGGIIVSPPEGFIVNDKEGPLKTGEIERAEKWAKEVGMHV